MRYTEGCCASKSPFAYNLAYLAYNKEVIFFKLKNLTDVRRLAPWTIRPRQLASDLQTTCPQFKNTYVTLDKYILCP